MRKVLFSLLVVVVALWDYGETLGQTAVGDDARLLQEGRVGGARRDVNDPRWQAEQERIRALARDRELAREQHEKRRQELLKMRRETFDRGKRPTATPELERFRREIENGMDPQQQLRVLGEEVAREEAKHLKRVARLERIQELASDEAPKQILTRAVVLVRKEQVRYARKRQRLDMRMRMLMRMQERRRQKLPQQPKPGAAKETSRPAVGKRSARGAAGDEGRKGDPGSKTEP
ncbi:MAG: hypothetical protein ACYS21_09115 [Planctomycetota bacterium]|jgi:hypothetical protein